MATHQLGVVCDTLCHVNFAQGFTEEPLAGINREAMRSITPEP